MNPLNTMLDGARELVRSFMRRIAKGLNTMSNGRLHPNTITLVGLFVHVPIAWLISTTHNNVWAAILLIIFGLFDTLDGELARLQKRTSLLGMFMDSATDRIKEVILYIGIVAALTKLNSDTAIVAAVAALGASLCTSYLNAWGDAVLASSTSSSEHKTNKSFRSGLLSFELRISLIIIGLLFSQLEPVLYIILALATLTVLQRFIHITGRLKNAKS